MPFYSTKTYGPERGLSCAYRQWDAGTDCQLLHGYALGFRFVFAAEQLDRRGWVVDFGDGGFGKIRRWLHKMFDHTLLVAVDDPARDVFESLAAAGLADLRTVPSTSCERLAQHVHDAAQEILHDASQGRCWLSSVECFEHSANSALFEAPDAVQRQTVADVLQAVLREMK